MGSLTKEQKKLADTILSELAIGRKVIARLGYHPMACIIITYDDRRNYIVPQGVGIPIEDYKQAAQDFIDSMGAKVYMWICSGLNIKKQPCLIAQGEMKNGIALSITQVFTRKKEVTTFGKIQIWDYIDKRLKLKLKYPKRTSYTV